MKQVYVARDLLEAQSVKDLLDAEGIESAVQGEYLSAAWGALPIDPTTSPSIWVLRDGDFDKASDCVEQFRRSSPERTTTPWKCERCGELIDTQFTECWKCAADAAAIAEESAGTEIVPASDEQDSDATDDQPAPPQPVASPQQTPDRSDRELWGEISVVILVVLVPSLFASVASFLWPEEHGARSNLHYSLSSFMYAAVDFGLVLYLIWRNRESWPVFGLVRPRWLVDSLVGLGIWATVLMMHGAFWRLLHGLFGRDFIKAGWRDSVWDPPAPEGGLVVLIFVLSVCANAASQELVMRAYLVPRFERLLRSGVRSILVTAALFGSFHIYQGLNGAVSAFISGLVYGTAFSWSRRLWPLVIAHSVGNLFVYWTIFAG